MHLADHIRPLLRDHDCVIIPDFGGLVADASSARAQPGRQTLSPPTKLVAFNQALTRNDGLLVDTLSQHLGLPIAQAREAVRAAVVALQKELDETNRTELPGIGIFRRAAGRGLAFEYTGNDNLLAAAFGLPELAARPVRAADSRLNRPQPALRGAATRRSRLVRWLPGSIIAVAAGLLLLANYQVLLNRGYVATNWQAQLPTLKWAQQRAVPASAVTEPQQAALSQQDFNAPLPTEGLRPLEENAAALSPVVTIEPHVAALNTEAAPAPAVPVYKPETVTKAPVVVAPKAAPAKPVAPVARPAKAAAPAVSLTIKTRTGRYYVIAGAYASLANAEKGRKVLARSGRSTRIILPHYGSRLFRLTAADYADQASAQIEAQRLRVSTHCDYNTLKF